MVDVHKEWVEYENLKIKKWKIQQKKSIKKKNKETNTCRYYRLFMLTWVKYSYKKKKKKQLKKKWIKK